MTQQTMKAGWRNAALAVAIVAALGVAGCGKKTEAPAPATPAAPNAASPGTEAATAEHVDTDADLLTKAKTAENEKRLYAPASDNAIEYYLALRARNHKDASVNAALLDLFPYAMIATEQNLKKGDEPGRVEAARIFALLERVDANAPSLPRLRTMMQKEAADELKQQQDAAKKAQADLEKKTEADKAAAAAAAKQQQSAAARRHAAPSPSRSTGSRRIASSTTGTRARESPPPASPRRRLVAEHRPHNRSPAAEASARTGSLPDVVSSAQPSYPPEALRDGVSGEVTVSFTVNADGSVSGATIVSSNPRRVFDGAALDAIRKWKFEAPGEPVTGRKTFAFNPGN